MAQLVKNCLQCGRPGFDPWVGKIPGGRHGNPLCIILAWRIPMGRGACRLQSMGSQRVRHDWATKHSMACYFKKKKSKNYLFLSNLPVLLKANDKILGIRIFNIFLVASYILGSWISFFFFCLYLLIFTHLCHFLAWSLMTWSDCPLAWFSNLHFRFLASSYLIKNRLMGLSNFYYKMFLESSPEA